MRHLRPPSRPFGRLAGPPRNLPRVTNVAGSLLLAACLGVTFLLLNACGDEDGAVPRETRATPVETVRVERVDLEETLQAVGTLEAPETVEVRSELTAPVARRHFEEGASVGAGDLLVTLEEKPVRQRLEAARGALESARARRDMAERTFRRFETLRQRGSVSQEELDRARTTLEEARGEVDRLQAEVEAAEEALGDTRVRAPMDGRVAQALADPGDLVEAGDPLVVLYSAEALEIVFQLPERHLGRVETGQTARLSVDPYPERTFEGEVTYVSPAVSGDTRQVRVKARLDDPEGLLRPGLFADVSLVVDRLRNRPVIPEEALVSTRQGYVVFTVEDGTAHRRPVELGLRRPGRVEITSGLEAGERVVRRGAMNLTDGAPVEVRRDGGDGSRERPEDGTTDAAAAGGSAGP